MKDYLNSLIPLIIGIAVVAFLYGVVRYIYSGGDEEKRQEGIKFITYGIVGLAVMTSVWALVSIISVTFTGTTPGVPQITPSGGSR